MQITAPVYHAVNNPYGIYTPKHLSDIRNGLNDSYVLMNDIDLPNLNAADAAANVGISDYATYGWFSIGAPYVNGGHVIFRGSLDGQNHVINNLTTSYRGSNVILLVLIPGTTEKVRMDCLDMQFMQLSKTSVSNWHLQVLLPSLRWQWYGHVGGLVGLADSSTITNCYVIGNAGNYSGGQYTGGLIGSARNSNHQQMLFGFNDSCWNLCYIIRY